MFPILVLLFLFFFDQPITADVECMHSELGDCCFPDLDFYGEAGMIGTDCVYGYVVELNWRNIIKAEGPGKFNTTTPLKKKNIISTIPPLQNGTNISMAAVFIDEINVDEESQHFSLKGYCELYWKDERLRWNRSVSNREYFISDNKQNEIWHPDFVTNLDIQSNSASHDSSTVVKSGHVYSSIQFDSSTKCSFDYTRFPYDQHECCIDFYLDDPLHDNITLTTDTIHEIENLASLSKLWSIVKFETHNSSKLFQYGKDDIKTNRINYAVCITIKRESASALNEFVLPGLVAIILTIILPLFGSLKIQVVSKCFCLGLQYACMFMLIRNTEQLQFGSTTPNILKFYECLIWTTVFNLFSTLTFWSLTARASWNIQFVPPPSILISLASLINRYLWCAQPDPDKITPQMLMTCRLIVSVDAMEGNSNVATNSQSHNSKSATWENVWRAKNTFFTMIFAVIYVLETAVTLM